jgi:hypothetical protein
MLHPAVTIRRTLPPPLAFDRAKPSARLARARRAEIQYASQLRKLARFIGDIITGLWDPDHPETVTRIDNVLRRYAKTIEPWAEAVAGRMVEEVAVRDRQMWKEIGDQMGRALRREIDTAPTGAVMQQRLADQVRLITSLPCGCSGASASADAGKPRHERAGVGDREGDHALRGRHREPRKANRSYRGFAHRDGVDEGAGRARRLTHFVWVTVGDSDVRPSHRKLNGTVWRWDDPPEATLAIMLCRAASGIAGAFRAR